MPEAHGTFAQLLDLVLYVAEQIFTLPGVARPRDEFSIVLTGSRATGTCTAGSDVDLVVVCARDVYESVQQAALADGRIAAPSVSFHVLRDDDWQRYYGPNAGRPHFSITPADEMERHFREHDDVYLWIWSHAVVLHDPGRRFECVRDRFTGYPPDVLVRKIQYRWMLAAYWIIDVYPHHASCDGELLPAATAVLQSINELYRFFFLVEGKPFPYPEKLPRFVCDTRLGKAFVPLLTQAVDLVVGHEWPDRSAWDRLSEASRLICDSDSSPAWRRLEQAAYEAMRAAGVDPAWVEADYDNIEELLLGKLGPMP